MKYSFFSRSEQCIDRVFLISRYCAHRSIVKLSIMAIATLAAFGALNCKAKAETVGIIKDRIGNEGDFGSGPHVLGIPGFATITWDYRVAGDVVIPTARVQGTLYIDRLGPGCARLNVFFKDNLDLNLSSRTFQFCGPGSNANSGQNQLPVDVSFPAAGSTNPNLRGVQLVVGSGATLGQIIDDKASTIRAVSTNIREDVIINSERADFGKSPHLLGSPAGNGSVSLGLRGDNQIAGNVSGTLYWDSSRSGCARLVIDFQEANGEILRRRVFNQCGPTGGNANSGSNQLIVNETFNSARLFKIRLRVGTVSGNNLTGVKTKTITYGIGNVQGP